MAPSGIVTCAANLRQVLIHQIFRWLREFARIKPRRRSLRRRTIIIDSSNVGFEIELPSGSAASGTVIFEHERFCKDVACKARRRHGKRSK